MNVKTQASAEENRRDNRLAWWGTWSDGEYCLLRAAHTAYQEAADTLASTHPYAPRAIRAERERLVESYWSAFVQLSWAFHRSN